MSVEIIVLFLTMTICFIIRMPVSFSMLTASIFYFLVSGENIGLAFSVITGNMYSSFIMLAAPLFIFTANVMNQGQITDKLFKFCNALFGKFKGGTAQVNIFASLVFSGMTGSAIADASGLGLIEIEHMKKEGYEEGFSCALTAASATVGPIFPPSIPMVIYSMLSGASIGKLFMGGMVPGILLSLILSLYVAYVSHKRNYPRGHIFTKKEFIKSTVDAIPALLTPAILLGGIYGGVVTPTEAGAISALYAIIVSVFFYRNLGAKEFWSILKKSASMTAVLGLLTGTAMLFSFIVALERVPHMATDLVLGFTDNKYLFLFVVNIVFLLLGTALDVSTIQLVFVPLVIPIVNALGIDLVHFGVVICLNMMIGLSTPPFGMLLFIVSGMSKTPIKKVIKEIMPMVAAMIILLFLITYIPQIVMWIPDTFGGR